MEERETEANPFTCFGDTTPNFFISLSNAPGSDSFAPHPPAKSSLVLIQAVGLPLYDCLCLGREGT